jgi:hypothetical protein
VRRALVKERAVVDDGFSNNCGSNNSKKSEGFSGSPTKKCAKMAEKHANFL